MITNPRHVRFTAEQVAALEHLCKTAGRKLFYGQLVANAYNNTFPCDLRSCSAYLAGEPDDRLKTGLLLIIELCSQGIEAHEYLGEEFVEGLIKQWRLRDNPDELED